MHSCHAQNVLAMCCAVLPHTHLPIAGTSLASATRKRLSQIALLHVPLPNAAHK